MKPTIQIAHQHLALPPQSLENEKTHLVKLLHMVDMHQSTRVVEDPNPVVDPQSRTKRRAKEVPSIGAPLAMTRVGRLDRADLLERLAVPDVDLTGKVTEPGDAEEAALRVVGEEVARLSSKVVEELDALVEDDGLGGHV